VATPLAQTARIAALPEIRLQDEVVDYGGSTKILVAASVEGDKYQPLLAGNPLRRARNGNGENISFNTDALIKDTEFEMLITRPNEAGLAVERLVGLRAVVRPNPALAVNPDDLAVAYNSSTEIRIEAGQPGVSYQLTVDQNPVGEAVEGAGDTLALSTGPLTEDSVFVVRATRVDNPNISTELWQQAAVQVRPEPEGE
jgi:hypothetical protein